MMTSRDDKARAIAKQILGQYNTSISNINNSASKGETSPRKADGYRADTRNHTAAELEKLAKAPGLSKEMREKIQRVTDRIKRHKPSTGHGAWWASSGSSDNPSSWI